MGVVQWMGLLGGKVVVGVTKTRVPALARVPVVLASGAQDTHLLEASLLRPSVLEPYLERWKIVSFYWFIQYNTIKYNTNTNIIIVALTP